jgi:peptidoglycan/xylan/chitin deacetylase (PgdA/CDA1 family)
MTLARRTLLTAALAAPAVSRAHAQAAPVGWPNGARLAVSVTMMVEADGEQPELMQPGPPGTPQAQQRFPNQPLIGLRRYGAIEGIPRLLDLFDRQGIRTSSFMIGASVAAHPEMAREIVRRGHEAGGRPWAHAPQFHLSRAEERALLARGFDTLAAVTGVRPKGFNARGLQGSANTLSLLAELGLTYTIDDRSRDEPLIVPVDGRDFAVLPYHTHVNDLTFFHNQFQGLAAYEQMLRQEFEVLLAEGERRRRMMSVPLHDFLAGRPGISRSVEAFIAWAKAHPGVWFAKREEIAAVALADPATPRATI